MVLGEKHGKWTAWKVTAQDLGGTSGSQSWIILVSFSLLCLNHDLLSLYCTLGAGDPKDRSLPLIFNGINTKRLSP